MNRWPMIAAAVLWAVPAAGAAEMSVRAVSAETEEWVVGEGSGAIARYRVVRRNALGGSDAATYVIESQEIIPVQRPVAAARAALMRQDR